MNPPQIAAFIVEGKCQTESKSPVVIHTTAGPHPIYPVVGSINHGDGWYSCMWRPDGSYPSSGRAYDNLVALPAPPEREPREWNIAVSREDGRVGVVEAGESPSPLAWELVRVREVLPGRDGSPTPSRYQWSYRGVTFDFYRLCEILEITSHPQAHALKKVIRAGRSIKPLEQDIEEAIAALPRWREMLPTPAPAKALPRYFQRADGYRWVARRGGSIAWQWKGQEGLCVFPIQDLIDDPKIYETDEHGTAIHAENFK